MILLRDVRLICNSNSYRKTIYYAMANHTFHMLVMIRIGGVVRGFPLFGRIFGRIIEYFIRIFFSSDVSCAAKIGPGFLIMHGHDIVIGADAVIGCKCKIFNGVTIGNKDTTVGSKGNQPIIGNGVLMGTGAKILGPIRIGDNATIGANAVVLCDVPPGALAVGVPARVIKENQLRKKRGDGVNFEYRFDSEKDWV